MFALLLTGFYSCKEPPFLDNARLEFSTHLMQFDTVFSTIGSSVQPLIVYNRNENPVKISVRLGGSPSCFSFNIDGTSGPVVRDIEIAAKDSVKMFVKVTINPNGGNTPFLVTDSLIFSCGNTIQEVDLLAFGQDAHFIIADKKIGNIPYKIVAAEYENITWENDKPYVIYGYAVVDSTAKLTIEKGCRIYFHKNSGLWVYKDGNLQVKGTKDEPVKFQGDRLDSWTWLPNDYAQWDRIWLNESTANHSIEYAVISHAFIGIQVETLGDFKGNKLILKNTIIKNNERNAILARAYNIDAENCLIFNQGASSLELSIGNFDFKHITIANYFEGGRKNPALHLTNNYKIENQIFIGNTQGYFTNCIIDGNLVNEISTSKTDNADLNYRFENCAVKQESHLNSNFMDCLRNINPQFENVSKSEYQLKSTSPLIGKGKSGIGVFLDLDGNTRKTPPDIGAYETK